MEQKAAKRFYKQAEMASVEGGFGVHLDGRALKSPAKAALILPSSAMAEAITAEFNKQEEDIVPASMPIFSLASTVIDRILPQRDILDDELVRYGLNDLICYRAEEDEDKALAVKQNEIWGDIQNWIADTYGILLQEFQGVMPQSQAEIVAQKYPLVITTIDSWSYVALYRVTTLSGSLALGLAFRDGKLDVNALMTHAFLDEYHQEEKWGADEWAVERRDNIKTEFTDMWDFLKLL